MINFLKGMKKYALMDPTACSHVNHCWHLALVDTLLKQIPQFFLQPTQVLLPGRWWEIDMTPLQLLLMQRENLYTACQADDFCLSHH